MGPHIVTCTPDRRQIRFCCLHAPHASRLPALLTNRTYQQTGRFACQRFSTQLDRPLVAVIDTGTTGVSVSDTLFDSGLLPTQWRDARIEMRSEKGATCALEASIRKKRKPSLGVPAVDLPYSAAEYDEFPLVISPVRVPWFDPGFGNEECADGEPFQCNGLPLGQRRSILDTAKFRALGLGPAPHVIFVGMAFLWPRQLTIDVDERRMRVV